MAQEKQSGANLQIQSISRLSESQKIGKIDCRKKPLRRKRLQIQKFKSRNQIIEDENYFHQMYKDTKKRVLVNLFIKKLKQSIIKSSDVPQQFFLNQGHQDRQLLKQIKVSKKIQTIFLIVFILQAWVFSILASFQAAFDNLIDNDLINLLFIIPAIVLIVQAFTKVLIHPQLIPMKVRKGPNYISKAYQEYLRSWMIPDIILFFICILGIIIGHPFIQHLRLLYIIKTVPAIDYVKNLEIYYIQNNFKMQYWQLAKVFIFNFVFGHFLAIVLILIATGQSNWINNANIDTSSWFQMYIWGYYWAVNIMLTVGFGDISATNSQQALGLIFIETLSCIVLAYNINRVGTIITKISSYQEQRFKDLKIFNHMQCREQVSEPTQKKINNYINESAQVKKKFNVEEEERLLQKLPINFLQQYKKQTITHIFSQIPFFRCLNLRKIQQISVKIEKKLAHPQQILLQANQVPKISIINHGIITHCLNKHGSKYHGKEIQRSQIKENEYKLLSKYFFINKPINYDIKCKNYCINFSMSNQDLKTIISSQQSCYQSYCVIKDSDNYNPNDLQTQLCHNCTTPFSKSFHTLFQCPKLHYKPLKQIIISKAIKNKSKLIHPHLNSRLQRYSRPKVSSLKLFTQMKRMTKPSINLELNSGEGRIKFYMDGEQCAEYDEQLDNFQCVTQNQMHFLMHSQFVKTFSSRKNEFHREDFKKICAEIANGIKDQISKHAVVVPTKHSDTYWDLQCDQAHNFNHYFVYQNPSEIQKCIRKRKLRIKKKLFLKQD